MKMTKQLMVCALLALLLVPAAVFGQEQAPERGMVEFGFRGLTGTVDGRTNPGDVRFSNGFRPDLLNSTLNTYNDFRNGFYIPRSSVEMNDFLGTKSYFTLQSASNGFAFEGGRTLNRDESVLATFGHYGVYKIQFRWDETPHIFSGTTRTLFGAGGPGRWMINPALQTALYGVTSVNTGSTATAAANISAAINSAVAGTLVGGVPGATLFTQEETRKTATGSASWNITPNWSTSFLFSRENQTGTRPLGMVMGSGSGSYQLDIPESIDYFTTNIKVGTEFGKKHWDAMLAYQTSLFQNNIPSMLVDNPFSTVYTTAVVGPATSRMNLYPDNRYQQFVGAGAVDIGKYIRIMANVTPGVMTQDASFQPTSTNDLSLVAGGLNLTPAVGFPNLPQPSLNGRVNTLAMNYTAVFQAMKNLQLVAKYQQYDYDNQTPELLVRDVIGDTALTTASNPNCNSSGYCQSEQSSFHRKTFDLGGTWFFTKKNSAKVGYQREWMDRENRHVSESLENSVYAAVDLNLRKNVLLRVSARHQNRTPQDYDNSDGFLPRNAGDFYYLRMYDQGTRLRNRGDVSLQWNATDKLSLSAFGGTLQDNYNVRDAVNSLTPLGDVSHSFQGCEIGATNYGGTAGVPGGADPVGGVCVPGVALHAITRAYGNYYVYGLLNSIGRNYGVDASYALTKNIVVFGEYVRERNTGAIVGGNQKSTSTCALTTGGFYPTSSCDPINDVITGTKDVVDTYLGGADITVAKKLNVSVYYSLSAAQSYINSDGVSCQIGNGPSTYCKQHFASWSLDTVPNPALTFGYPEDVSRIHEVGAIAKFKLTKNLLPKFQYTYRLFTNKDFQTGVVNPYSYVGTAIDPGTAAANPISGMQKFLSLGADTPSYKAHIFSATLEYHF